MRRPIRPWLRVPRRRRPAAARPKGGILLPVLIGIGLAVAVIVLIDAALRPTVTELAKAKVKNAVTSIINDAVNETLSSEAISYGDLVTLEKDTAGQVTVLAANTAQLNALRTEILGRILEQVEQLDSQELGIPLGNLTGFATASDLGPVLPVRVLTAATPTAAFEHVFTSSGINQTLHQVMLNVQVECTLLEPAVRLLMERLHLPRRGAAALCTAALTAAVLGGLALVVWRVGYELSLLLGRLPTLLAGLPTLADGLERWAYRFLIALPVQFQTLARDALEGLLEQSIALPNRFYDALAGAVTGLASALPAAALFLFTTVLATYFTSAGRPALLDGLRRRLPPPWRTRLGRVAGGLREALGGWLKAQGLLMLITFGELAAGFLLLRVELSLLLAGLVALVDALPVFGTGTVLLPWAVLALLGGDVRMSVGLLVLYSVISLVRSLLEPRLVGARVGLPPLAALVCMYVGFQALGVLGMLLAPLAAVLARQLWDSGLLHSLFGP